MYKRQYYAGRVSPELLPRYYRSASIFCSPATGQESFGIVLLEAMASGIPVVASDIPGYRNVVTHLKNGILVPPKNPGKLAEAIIELAEDINLKDKLISEGRAKALTYDWPVVTDMLERVFKKTKGLVEQKDKIHQVV